MEQHLQAASLTLSQRYRTFSWSNSRWREVSGSKEHKAKSDKWLQDASDLRANLLSTPTPKVADTQAFGIHINHRLQHALAVQQHFTKPCRHKLRRKRKIRHQKALQEVCNCTAPKRLWHIVMLSSAASAEAWLRPRPLHCDVISAPLADSVKWRSSTPACCAVHATKPWLARQSLASCWPCKS